MKYFHIFVLLFLTFLIHFNNGANIVEKCLDCLTTLLKSDSEPKINPSQLECVADFLLLTKKEIRTEIYAEQEDWLINLLEPKWKIGRRIVLSQTDIQGKHGNNHHKNDVIEWGIYENKMAELLGQSRAKKCFADNHEYAEWHRRKGKKERLLSMSKILADYNILYLNLSNAFSAKLDSMQSCLLGFLAKYKSLENIKHEAAPENIRSAENAIKNNFKMTYHLKSVVFRWEVHESDKESLKYKRNTDEFRDLEKCTKKLFEKKDYISINDEVFNANKLLEYFNADQLYLRDYPYYMEIFTMSKTSAKNLLEGEASTKTVPGSKTETKTGSDEEKCSVCQENYENEDRIQRVFPCKHTFHASCVQEWFKMRWKNT